MNNQQNALLLYRLKKAIKLLREKGPKEFISRTQDFVSRRGQINDAFHPAKTLEYDIESVHYNGKKLTHESLIKSMGIQGKGRFVLAVSQDNYLKVVGGVQLKISDQQQDFNELGVAYIHIFPYKTRESLDFSGQEGVIGVSCNNKFVGYTSETELSETLKNLLVNGGLEATYLHHLMGWRMEFITHLLELVNKSPIYFWLHDFFSICPGYTLLRNDKEYCHAPNLESNACQLCVYGTIRPLHYQAFTSLFQTFPIQVVAPSEFALDLWREKFPVNSIEGLVRPNATLEWGEKLMEFNKTEPLRVAFVGYPVLHKGWQTWVNLTNQFGKDSRYKFFLFSADRQPSPNFENVSVEVTKQNRSAMTEALRKNRIDVAFLWSICPETFSFTLYESLAAGCIVITNPSSGNIQAYIKAHPGEGMVLDGEKDLFEHFEGNTLVDYLVEHQVSRRK